MENEPLNKIALFSFYKLIKLIQYSDCEEEINLAKSYLYKNLYEDFYSRCFLSVSKLYRNFPHWNEYVDDVFQETFITAFNKPKMFRSNDAWSENQFRNQFLFWMGEIANHKILKHINQKLTEEENNNRYVLHVIAQSNSGNIGKRKYKPTYDKPKFDELWKKLNSMTKEILLLCAEHDTLNENNKTHLPDEEIQRLKKKYDVGSDAIRKAKERGIKLLKECKIES